MGISYRKSASFGPLRLNFSKSGIGASFGIPGLRVGTLAKGGLYVRGGRHGVYYRKTLSTKPRRVSSQGQRHHSPLGF